VWTGLVTPEVEQSTSMNELGDADNELIGSGIRMALMDYV